MWASVLGFPNIWGKADGGTTVRWTGTHASASPTHFTIEILQGKIEEILHLRAQTSTRRIVGNPTDEPSPRIGATVPCDL